MDRRVNHGIVFSGCRCSGDIFAGGRNGHGLRIAGACKITIERFYSAVACNTAAGLPGGNRPDDLTGKPTIFAKAIVVHGTAQGCSDAAGLPTDGTCGALLHMTTYHAGKPACKGIAGGSFRISSGSSSFCSAQPHKGFADFKTTKSQQRFGQH